MIRAQDKAVCGGLGKANLHPDLGTSQLNYECTQATQASGKGERLTDKIDKDQISFVAISMKAQLEYARPTPMCQVRNNTFRSYVLINLDE